MFKLGDFKIISAALLDKDSYIQKVARSMLKTEMYSCAHMWPNFVDPQLNIFMKVYICIYKIRNKLN